LQAAVDHLRQELHQARSAHAAERAALVKVTYRQIALHALPVPVSVLWRRLLGNTPLHVKIVAFHRSCPPHPPCFPPRITHLCVQAADEAAARVALAEGRGADLSATLSAQRKATDDADARARATDGARHAAAVALGVSDGRAVALGYEAEMLRERGERLEEDLETVRGWAGAAGPH
jgi:hypothetical protein